ncbi:MAG: hypothetical protein HY862_06780 [Chloroflexi bacterium]|nr:hypothetical protein [Chloroflexota bacterium]
MSTTTLRAYLDELDLLLQREALEEVIGHCRHILQHYPKNVETYRLFGKALLEKARYEEAAQVFPRLLSADPNDFVAHVGMSSIFENQQQPSQAIWHMERAYEQMPNNNVILNELKRLYKRRDEVIPRKIQLTRAALAQQYLSSGMHEQAITELRRGLVEQPNRLDLRVRLTNALWDAGHMLEAGELALEVLRVLPDCLPLNLLMAKLWIESRRPDDAKAFLEKVEALAPYESLKLIYKTDNQAALPEGAFVLTRLKWTADAASSVAGPTPDWISQITDVFNTPESIAPTRSAGRSSAPSQDLPDWMSEVTATTPSTDLPDWFTPGADFGGKPKTAELAAPDDWFNEMASTLSQPTSKVSPTPAKTPPPPVPVEDELPDWFTDVAETAPVVNPEDLFADISTGSSTPDWMFESPSPTPETVAPTASWLDEVPDFSNAEPPPTRKSTGFTGLLAEIQQAEDEQPAVESEDVPSWLNEDSSTSADNEPPSIFGDVPEFSFSDNPDEHLEQLRAAARPPSAEEVAALLALGGRKPEEAEEELPDWLVDETPEPAPQAPTQSMWDEENLFENFGAIETTPSTPSATPSWLSDVPDSADETEVTTLFDDETPDWLTDVPDQEVATYDTAAIAEDEEVPNFTFGDDDWLTGQPATNEEPAATPIFQIEEEVPAADEEADWLTDAVATDLPSLTLEKVGEESAEEFASLFEDELITPAASTEKRLGVTGELPWRQGVSESSTAETSVDEFATLFDSQLPEQPLATTPSRLGVTGELPWRQETDSDSAASPNRRSSLDEVDWNAIDSQPAADFLDSSTPETPEVVEVVPEISATPVDDLSSWLNVPPQTSSIAEEVSDDEFGDLFGSDLIPGTAWLDDVQHEASLPGVTELLPTGGDEEVPDWMRDVEPIQTGATDVTDAELDNMFGSSLDEFSAIGEPSTGWLTDAEPSTASSDDWMTSFEEPSAQAAGATIDLSEEINDDWLLSMPSALSNSLATEVSDTDLSNLLGDDFSDVGTPSTGWLDNVAEPTNRGFDSAFDDLSDVSTPSTGWLDNASTSEPEATPDWLSAFSQPEPPQAQSAEPEFGSLFDDLSEIEAPRTGWLDDVSATEPDTAADWLSSFGQDEPPAAIPQAQSAEPEFGNLFDDLSEIETPHTGWLDDVSATEPDTAADWLSSFGQDEPPAAIPQAQSTEPEFGSLFDDLSEIEAPRTGWLDDVSPAEPNTAADWLSSFGQDEPPAAIPQAQSAEPEFGNLFDDLSEIETPHTGWLDDVPVAEPNTAADWLSSFGQDEPPASVPEKNEFPDWLSGAESDFENPVSPQPTAVTDSGFDSLFGDLSEIETPHTGWLDDVDASPAEPESASDWLGSIGKSEPTTSIPMAEPAASLPDWLAGVEIEEEPAEPEPVAGFDNLFQDMSTTTEPRTGWLDLEEQESEEFAEAASATDWTDSLLVEDSEIQSAAPDWLSDDIRLDTSDIQMATDFDEPPVRASVKESVERAPQGDSSDNIDAFLASITSQKRVTDQTEAMISELDQLTGFKLRELTPEEVEGATRPSSPVPTSLPEEFPDEADFGFGQPEPSPVAIKHDLPDTNISPDDDFPEEWDLPAKTDEKRGRRLFGKRKEKEPVEVVDVATASTPTAANDRPASFDFDRDPPWLRKTKGTSESPARKPSAEFDALDFGEDDEDVPPDWFK